ncbi:hypothetical protein GTQ40_08915 [Flavobacteriaceae bacterium R38]|nr:hypothetical protein [Flavobacteriaceae bacterium R38]
MNCQHTEKQLIDYINHNLDDKTHKQIKLHLNKCNDCQLALEELQTIFNAIDNAFQEYPDENLRENFEIMLQKEKAQRKKSDSIPLHQKENKLWKSVFQIAASFALLFMGYLYGNNQNRGAHTKELSVMEQENLQMKTAMTISMIENESASKRLQAVNFAKEFEHPGNEILNALINKMHYDNHVSVRLAAATALNKFSNQEVVRKALISALNTESNPSMQIELIQILVGIQEKRAIPTMEKILQDDKTPAYIKDEIKVELSHLI